MKMSGQEWKRKVERGEKTEVHVLWKQQQHQQQPCKSVVVVGFVITAVREERRDEDEDEDGKVERASR